MAIFETGSVTTVPNLLNNLVAFCVANGWTSNYNAVEGSGRRAHLQLSSDVFINLRALVNEIPQIASFSGAVNGLAVNGSTGYDAGQLWYNQPGYPNNGVLGGSPSQFTARMAGIMAVSGAISAYYFHARNNMIYIWVEYATGSYQFMCFGKIEKHGTWSGGTVFFASGEGHSNTVNSGTIGSTLVGSTGVGIGNLTGNTNGYMYGTIDGLTGWLPASNTNPTVPNMPRFFSSINLQTVIVGNAANQFNGLPVLLPIDIAVARDGAGNIIDTTNFSIEGYLPDIYYCNMRMLIPAQQLDDGSGDIFRIYPFRTKSTDNTNGGWSGVAIKEN